MPLVGWTVNRQKRSDSQYADGKKEPMIVDDGELSRYSRYHEKFWKDIRNDVGGHFGSKAAEFAVDSFLPNASGAIELHLNRSGKGGAVLGFASEIVATALLRPSPVKAPSRR